MALTVSSKIFADDPAEGSADEQDLRHYKVVYEIDQTDTGPLADGVAVGIAAQQLVVGNPLPLLGDNYVFSDGSGPTTDLDAYALKFSWRRPYPREDKRRWHFTVEYGQPTGDPGNVSQPDPLMLATEYWVEWTEEQVVLDKARIVESMDQVGRAAGTLGPIINAAGVETSEALMKTIFYPVLCCEKPYADLSDIVALNNAYQGTTNAGTFFGAPPRTAKYLLTESSRLQRAGGISYFKGVTRIWFKQATWDRLVLNNGWSHLEGNPIKRVDNLIREKPDDPAPTVKPSEPLNLNGVGGILPENQAANYITYRDLTELNYAGIGIGS